MRSRLLPGLLVFAYASTALALSEGECRKLVKQYRDTKFQADQLEKRIHSDAQNRLKPKEDLLSEKFAELQEILKEGDPEDVKKKLDKLREQLKLEKGKLKEFLDGTSEGLGKAKDYMDKAQKGLKALETAISLLEPRKLERDPAEVAKNFANYVDNLNSVLGDLIGKVPGLGAFMDFYSKALTAIAKAIGKIQEHRRNASVQALGEDIYDPRHGELEELRKKQRQLRARILRGCRKYWVWYQGHFMYPEEYKEIKAEEARVAAEREAARKEAARKAKAKRDCEAKLRQLKSLKNQIANLGRQIMNLGKQASTSKGKAHNDALAKRIKDLRRQQEKKKREFQDIHSWIRVNCDESDAPGVSSGADGVERDMRSGMGQGIAGAGRVRLANQIIEEETQLRECMDRCRQCMEQLKKLQKELDDLTEQLKGKKGQVGDAEQRIKDAEEEYEKTKEKSKTHVYQTSSGKIVLSATKTAPGLDYKGWIISGAEQRKVREARRKHEQAKKDLETLKKEIQDLEGKVARKKRQVERKKAECEKCRKACQDDLGYFALQYERYLKKYGWSRGVLEEGEKLQAAGAALDRRVGASLNAAGRQLQPAPVRQRTAIPDLDRAKAFSATYAAGKSKPVLAEAGRLLGPFQGSFLVGASTAFRIDATALTAMGAGSQAIPRRAAAPYSFREPIVPATSPATSIGGTGPGGPVGAADDDDSGGGGFLRPEGNLAGTLSNRLIGGTEPLTGGAGGFTGQQSTPGTNNSFGPGQGAGGTRLPQGQAKGPGQGGGRDADSTDQPPGPPGVQGQGALGADELGSRAGPSGEAPTAFTARTRWETVKRWIRKFMESYVSGDLSGVMGTLSKNFIQDWTILRQAIQEDFKGQTNINVDIQLLEFRMTFDTVIVVIKWSRTATDQETGQTVINTGRSRLLFDRHDGLRLTAWFLTSPFGFFTAAWQAQVAAGDPNAGSFLPYFFGDSGFFGMTNTGVCATHETGVIFDFDSDGGVKAIARCSGPQFESEIGALNSGDFVVDVFSLTGGNVQVREPSTVTATFSPGIAFLHPCAGNPPFDDLGSVVGSAISQTNFAHAAGLPVGNTETRTYSFRTFDGRFGFCEVSTTRVGAAPVVTHQVRVRYKTAKSVGDEVVDPDKSSACN